MFNGLSLPSGYPVTLTLIVVNALLYLGQLATNQQLTNLGLLYGPAVEHGEYWRLLTAGFLHGSLLHVAFNLYLLYILGPQLERRVGSSRFLLVYIGALLGGSLAVMLFNWQNPTLGASGAVLGLAGAMGVMLHQMGVKPQQSPVFGLVILNLALPLLVSGISFWGHLGGVAAGALMAYLLIWLPEHSPGGSTGNALSIGCAAVAVLLTLSVVAANVGMLVA